MQRFLPTILTLVAVVVVAIAVCTVIGVDPMATMTFPVR